MGIREYREAQVKTAHGGGTEPYEQEKIDLEV